MHDAMTFARLSVPLLTILLVAGCTPISTPPTPQASAGEAVVMPSAGPVDVETAVSPADSGRPEIAAMEAQMEAMRARMGAMSGTPSAEDMGAMMGEMQGMLDGMQSMMGSSDMPMDAAHMQRMQVMMGHMESMGMRMQDMHGMMSGMGMDAMGKASFDDMMKGMGEMHQQLDGQMPSGDPHHPTPTP